MIQFPVALVWINGKFREYAQRNLVIKPSHTFSVIHIDYLVGSNKGASEATCRKSQTQWREILCAYTLLRRERMSHHHHHHQGIHLISFNLKLHNIRDEAAKYVVFLSVDIFNRKFYTRCLTFRDSNLIICFHY